MPTTNKTDINLSAADGYLIIAPAQENSSQFSAEEETNRYKVIDGTAFTPESIVYVLEVLGKIEFKGSQYSVCSSDQVVAYVA